MKIFLFTLSLITLCLFCTQSGFAQEKYSKNIADSERFSAGVLIGFNNAQMDGDFQAGYDKIGITGGIRGIARINTRLDFNIEMLYSKKGSKIFSEGHHFASTPKKDRIIDLTYVDAPMYFKWLLKDLASTWHIEAGGIYSRLVNTKITEKIDNPQTDFSYEDIAVNFGKDDISILLGFGHTWKNGFAINGRYTFGVKKFYKNNEFEAIDNVPLSAQDVEFLRNYQYSLNLSYTIFQRELKSNRSRK